MILSINLNLSTKELAMLKFYLNYGVSHAYSNATRAAQDKASKPGDAEKFLQDANIGEELIRKIEKAIV